MVIIDANDIGKSENEILMDLIFESAGFRIPLEKITFGHPMEMDFRPDVDTDPNTFIPVTVDAEYDNRFTINGNDGLLYRRRALSDHFPDNTVFGIYTQQLTTSLSQVLDQINALLSYPLTINDVIDQSFPSLSTTSITIKANPWSLIWIGEATILLNIQGGDRTNLLAVTDLEGF